MSITFPSESDGFCGLSVTENAVIEQVKGGASTSLTSPVEDAHFLLSTHMAAHNTL